MNYNKFPVINHIDDIIHIVDQHASFGIYDKGFYKIACYDFSDQDTFDTNHEDFYIRCEYRGLIFDSESGILLRRPFHKFFNMNENPVSHESTMSLSEPHTIFEKLDGSMIAPWKQNNKIYWGTKRGITDVSQDAELFINKNSKYLEFVNHVIDIYTPIFEYCSSKNKIVLDYDKENLIITGLRNIKTGKYVDYTDLARMYDIPMVNTFSSDKFTIKSFIEYSRNLVGEEGYVIDFDGRKIKIKSDWYCDRHHIATDTNPNERIITKLILENSVDDLIPIASFWVRDKIIDLQKRIPIAIENTSKIVSQWLSESIGKDMITISKFNFQNKLIMARFYNCYHNNISPDDMEYIKKELTDYLLYVTISRDWFNKASVQINL